jgi:glycosyltransferase involved in cell wall biosynthesis
MGKLDGLIILRYGHIYDSGGGMEQYLADLNKGLSERNRLHTIQVQLTSDPARVGESEAAIGQGRILRSSLFVDQDSHEKAVTGHAGPQKLAGRLNRFVTERVLFFPFIRQLITKPFLANRPVRVRPGEPSGLRAVIRSLHQRHGADLICLHSAGSADTAEVITFAQEHKIPVVYIHHFSNDRLAGFSMRTQIERMASVGGVCGVDRPAYLNSRFTTVADGIDTDFFRKENARPLGRAFRGPLIFLPARITPAKGQADVIRAAGILKRQGIAFEVALAGRVDSPVFEKEIHDLTTAEDVGDRVIWVGQLDAAGLRDWYAAASVLAFPTRHHEGLPRILLEAQAMELPPVVYEIGGTADGLLDKQTGHLIHFGDLASLAMCIRQIITDPERRAKFAASGRKLVEKKFSLRALAERHEAFYLQALGTEHSRRPHKPISSI